MIVSNKIQKSVGFAVDRLFHHKLFNQYVKRTSKFMTHVKTNQCDIGDRVSYPRPFFQGSIWQKHYFFSTATSQNASEDESKHNEIIAVTFVLRDGEEKLVNVPIGMSMLKAALANDIELEGACAGSFECSTCHVIVMDIDIYNKLEEPSDHENDMLDRAFAPTETSRLGCRLIAKPELDGLRLAIPAATRNFAVDGYVPKPH